MSAARSSGRRALRIGQFTPRAEPGELMIPALLGVGGSLLYLMETGTESDIWDAGVRARRAQSARRPTPGC